jgi:hypothetical protein
MNFVLFLCTDYNLKIHRFCQLINEQFTGVTTLMIVDNNDKDYSQYNYKEVYQISDVECVEGGFKNSFSGLTEALVKKNPISWDKAIYFLSKTKFDKAILIEDDCLVLNPKIFNKFFKINFDLLVPRHEPRIGNVNDWHWSSIEKSIEPPHYYSMVCCIGVSKKMIDKVIEHKNKIGSLFYAEAMFNTIAEHNNLLIRTPKELSSIVAMGDWNVSDFRLFKNNIFHPVKDIEKHNFYRFLNLVTLKNCLPVKAQIICPVSFEKLLIPKFLKR